jgi:hypothetical protein
MADNANSFPGFFPVGVKGQGEYKGTVNRYVHASGDSVALYKYMPCAATGASDATTGLPVVAALTNVYDNPTGIVVGWEVLPTQLNTLYVTASTRMVVLVADDPNLEFVAIGDDVGTTLDITHERQNVQYIAGTATTSNGNSNARLDSSTVGTGATDGSNNRTIRILSIYEEPGQSLTDGDKYKKFRCKFNNHSDTSTTGV